MGMVRNILTGRESRLLALGEAQLQVRAAQPSPIAPVPIETVDGLASPYQSPGALAQVTIADLFGVDVLGPIDRTRAMSIGAVAKGRHLICGTLATFPLVHMTGDTRTARQPILITLPEAGRPRTTSLTWWADAMLFYGRVWLRVTERYAKSEGERPRRVEWVPEWSATVSTAGILTHAFGRKVDPADVIRIDGPHEGLLNFAGDTLREALAIKVAAGNAAENPVPSINLHQTSGQPLTKEQIAELLAIWRAARTRPGGGIGFTNQSIEATAMGQPPEQLLIEGRNAAALDIARDMGLPAWAVDASVQGTSLNYTSVTGRSRELIDQVLRPYMAAIEERLSLDDVLPAGQWCRFDTSGALQGTFAERMAAYKIAREIDLYSVEELRAMEAGYALEGTPAL